MATIHLLARDIINDVLREVAPERYDLLKEIIAVEELHLTDKSSLAPSQVSALIEKAAKLEVVTEAETRP